MNQNEAVPDGGLFQSELWKEFQRSLGKETFETPWFFGVLQRAPILGWYGEVSRGPVQATLPREEVKESIVALGQEKNLSFLRLEPQYSSLVSILEQTGLRVRKAPFDVQPREILMISLIADEAEIFSSMKPKTRYNIRLAEKKGVTVHALAREDEEAQFLKILAATAKRKNISFHSSHYYQSFIRFFTEGRGQTFVAVKNGQVLAGSTVVFFGNTAYYVHGGSSDKGRDAMAPHLLQWEQIRFAKTKGCTRYDFGGVAISHQEKGKDWAGITRFKAGFAPTTESIVFPGTYDIIFSPMRYALYQWLSTFKNLFV